MRNFKLPVTIILLLAFCFAVVVPVTPAYAAGLSDLLPQLSGTPGQGGGGLINILVGLLLGKLFGNVTSDGQGGLVSKVLGNATAPPGDTAKGAAIIATARKYLGTPYVWGGTTPGGFDCSGFTQYVMRQNGITIPRTAAEQFAAGTPVDKSDLRQGDLVFFTTYKPGASHVGIYISDGQFIQAASTGEGVKISSLSEKFYTDHYIGARSFLR
jgi:cell wall-associated NlpC family hydrolase